MSNEIEININSDQAAILRQHAEMLAQEKTAQSREYLASLSSEEVQQTFHELHVHQIELEMQNDELRYAQAELNSAQTRYFDLYDLAPVGYCTIDAQGLILEANLTAATLLGKHRRALVGQPITHFILSEDQDTFYLHRKLLLGTGTPQSCELRLTRAGSKPFWAQLAATLAQEAGGAPVIRAVLIDITERKQAEEALRESDVWHRTILETAMDGFWMVDMQGHILEVNEAYCQMSGYSAQELLTMSIPNLEVVETANDIAARVKKVMAQSQERFETRHRRKDGTIFDIEVSIQYQPIEGGRIVAFLRDITERKQAEDALRKSEERFREVLESSLDASYKRNLQTNAYDYLSPVFTQISGYTPEEMKRLPTETVLGLMHPDDVVEVERVMAKATSGSAKTAYQVEYRFRHKEGRYRWLQDRFTVMRDADGTPLALIGSVSDITERKQIQAQMITSEKLAGLGTLAAGIAHELNSPLQVITGASDSALKRILKGDPDPGYISRSFETIKRNGWRCAEIVRSLLGYAHPSTEQFNNENLNSLVEDVLLLTKHQMESSSNITIITELSSDMPPLLCNRNQVTQVLINLLTNARDAMPKGGEITIRTLYETDTRRLILQVSDNGPGIPEVARQKIFDPFYTTKSIGQGTGLGLYIVASIVHLQGGEISIANGSPYGAIFTVSFPIEGPNFSQTTQSTGRY